MSNKNFKLRLAEADIDLSAEVPDFSKYIFQEEEVKKYSYILNLKNSIINVTDDIQEPEKAWVQTTSKTPILGTLGNFSLFTGKAKAKKTFYVGIAIAAALGKRDVLGMFKGCLPENRRNVIYFDTEQGPYHVHKSVKRICRLAEEENPKNLQVYHLRPNAPSERLAIIEFVIKHTKNLGFVVIDGIKDLVSSINDEEQASMIASKLLKWTEEENIHIVTVLHQNKGDEKARGHIGTELVNKAETVLSISKHPKNKEISVVEPQECRNLEPEPFAFTINEAGLPESVNYTPAQVEVKKKPTLMDWLPEKQEEVLFKLYDIESNFMYAKWWETLQYVLKQSYNVEYGQAKCKAFHTHCKVQNYITKDHTDKYWILNESLRQAV